MASIYKQWAKLGEAEEHFVLDERVDQAPIQRVTEHLKKRRFKVLGHILRTENIAERRMERDTAKRVLLCPESDLIFLIVFEN